MNQKTKEYREKIAQSFVDSLKSNPLNWKKNWTVSPSSCIPENAVTGARYKGINRLWLTHLSQINGLEDYRWATFKQIQDKGWKLNRGAKGEQVEYWAAYDFDKKKNITWKEFNQSKLNPEKSGSVGIISKQFYVFNGKDIEGIPELVKAPISNVSQDELIPLISKNMKVPILNDGGDRAFYQLSEDLIHLPPINSFKSSYDYNSVALHELSHATGAPHRLNRDLKNIFGSVKYAFEELVAEMSSCFMSGNLQTEATQSHLENHQAYVQSWIKNISENPNVLLQAIKEADKAANYLEYQAELITEFEYKKTLQDSKEVDTTEIKEVEHFVLDLKSFKCELKEYKFILSKTLEKDITALNVALGKNHSIKDIHALFKGIEQLENDIKPIVTAIVNDFKLQENNQLLKLFECER